MKILVVDDDELTRISIKSSLENPKLRGASSSPNQVTIAGSVSEAQGCLEREIFDVAFVDIRLGPYHRSGGIELLKHIQQWCPTTVVIMMTSIEDYETVERCLLTGAADYIFKPFDYQSVHLLMIKAQATHRLFRREQTLRAQAGDKAVTPIQLTSKSPFFQKVIDQAKKVQGTDLSVVILGETGVGKEVMARYIWSLEGDLSRPFAAVNTVGLTPSLIESELFGHVKGAFTGATEKKIGKFQYAHHGDLFLDEIALMPGRVQEMLLRVLQDKEITPVGSNSSIKVDCRIICATNEDPELLIKKGTFREDLYFRVKRVVLRLPPLRHRKEDIPDLIDYFLYKYSLGKKRLSQAAFRLCMNFDWPGNVRQLENAIETMAKMQTHSEITEEEIRTQILAPTEEPEPTLPASATPLPTHEADGPYGLTAGAIHRNYKHHLRQFEQAMVRIALREVDSETAAAEYLGLPRSTLVSRRKSWGWKDPEDAKTDAI